MLLINPFGAVTRTNNYGISPDGTQNATRVEISRGSSYAELYNRITTTGGETYTLSFWAKSLDGTPTLTLLGMVIITMKLLLQTNGSVILIPLQHQEPITDLI